MKIGFSSDPPERLKIANYDGWGGHRDWRLVAYAWSQQGGRIEGEFHRHFKMSHRPLPWVRNGKPAIAREAFVADLPEAVAQLVYRCDGAPQLLL